MVSFFENIVEFLNREEIPYMLTGSVALQAHTLGRTTVDFDFIIQITKEDVPKIKAHFSQGFYCDEDAMNEAIKHKSMFNVIDYTTGFKADFIILNDDEYERQKFSRRIKTFLFDKVVYVITPEDLWLSKLIWIQQLQSGRQMEDIKSISRLPALDWEYVRRWTTHLKLNTFDLLK